MSTIRKQMIELLHEEELDALEISQLLSIREREVYEHLAHIARTLESAGEKLIINPYRCLSCDYTFSDRSRLNRPGRCPRCKNAHISMATYTIR